MGILSTIYVDTAEKMIIIAFRGSRGHIEKVVTQGNYWGQKNQMTQFPNWKIDFDVTSVKCFGDNEWCHKGFLWAADKLFNGIPFQVTKTKSETMSERIKTLMGPNGLYKG
jgi:hypothetical protein